VVVDGVVVGRQFDDREQRPCLSVYCWGRTFETFRVLHFLSVLQVNLQVSISSWWTELIFRVGIAANNNQKQPDVISLLSVSLKRNHI